MFCKITSDNSYLWATTEDIGGMDHHHIDRFKQQNSHNKTTTARSVMSVGYEIMERKAII